MKLMGERSKAWTKIQILGFRSYQVEGGGLYLTNPKGHLVGVGELMMQVEDHNTEDD